MGSVAANATNTLAVWPGTVASTWAYRGHILDERRRGLILTLPSAVGGLLGSWVLLNTPEKAFNAVVPWLILLACALITFQNTIARFVRSHRAQGEGRVPAALWVAQLLVSFYGGYFGAGMGIIMLAFMGILLPTSLQHANGLKLLFSVVINGVAAVYFLVAGAASLPHAERREEAPGLGPGERGRRPVPVGGRGRARGARVGLVQEQRRARPVQGREERPPAAALGPLRLPGRQDRCPAPERGGEPVPGGEVDDGAAVGGGGRHGARDDTGSRPAPSSAAGAGAHGPPGGGREAPALG